MNTEGFRDKIREYRRTVSKSQEDLARAVGLDPFALSNKLNRTKKAQLTFGEIKSIVRSLADWEALYSRKQVYELLALTECPDFGLEDWQTAPLSRLEKVDERTSFPVPEVKPVRLTPSATQPKESWGQVLDLPTVYGRETELAALKKWIVTERCRVVTLVGMGGMGKTTLSVALARQVKGDFEFVFWRSLQNAPRFEDWLGECLQFLGETDRTDRTDRLADLMVSLGRRRCLLVLDNFETVLQERDRAGHYRPGYEDFGRLLRLVGQTDHRSCLVLTSREKPRDLTALEGPDAPVRSLTLSGLNQRAGLQLLQQVAVTGSPDALGRLVSRYAGNPLALKLISATIRELFDNRIETFLAEGETIFGDVRDLLDQHFKRLSGVEKEILYRLTIEREAHSLSRLFDQSRSNVSRQTFLEGLQALHHRALVEKSEEGFSLQPVVLEYLTDRLVEGSRQECINGKFKILAHFGLLNPRAKEYLRHTQLQLLILPWLQGLRHHFKTDESLEQHLLNLLDELRLRPRAEQGYAGGNLVNLLYAARGSLRGYNLSNLNLWQAFLVEVELQGTNLAGSDLSGAAFSENFGAIFSVKFSPDGTLLAAGTGNGEVRVWRVADQRQILLLTGHTSWVWAVAFSPDGQSLVSGSDDHTVRLWDVESGVCRRVWSDHEDGVMSVAFSPDGRTVASASLDRTVRLWSVVAQESRVLRGHTDGVWSVAFSPNGGTLATGSLDCTVRLWQPDTAEAQAVLEGHRVGVVTVAFSPDGRWLASSGHDAAIRLWEWAGPQAQCVRILTGHGERVLSVAFDPTSRLLASSSQDRTLKLWELERGACLATLADHSDWVMSVAFKPDGTSFASGSLDRTVRLWEGATLLCQHILHGHTEGIWSLAFSPDGQSVATGSEDRWVRLWNVAEGSCEYSGRGHQGRIYSLAFSPDGRILASGSDDTAVRIWDRASGRCLQILQADEDWVIGLTYDHTGKSLATASADRQIRLWDVRQGHCQEILSGHGAWVLAVAFSPDDEWLATGSQDRTVRLWQLGAGQTPTVCRHILEGHDDWVMTVSFSPDGRRLVTGSRDHTLRIWDVASGQSLHLLTAHHEGVMSVAWNATGDLIASGSNDHQVILWDATSFQPQMFLTGHTDQVKAVAFSPDGTRLATGSLDRTVRIWDTRTGECLKILRNRLYEQLNITGVSSLTDAQKLSLFALGAVEH